MKLPFLFFVLTLVPTFAAAQSLDIADDPVLSLSDTDASVSEARPDTEDLEGQIGSTGPVLVEPKFDMTAEHPEDFGDANKLHHTDPEPAPGLVIKIPTN